MGALLYHVAVVQDQDVVRVLDGGEAVGDDEAGAGNVLGIQAVILFCPYALSRRLSLFYELIILKQFSNICETLRRYAIIQ